ncbi:HpcH/HpaI aldolase [Candidatus Magnetobacterium bavaricum]|uniref:HpcH/HpaI aldolase n=1 Tax=Candidatus Magnetobacterium bavaricum TaxID=29290 RepID=A0A0F3GJG8_9BACT|nr:HpcH/HpaI aldolase [Candidatus Magnetobacterium bavaricum]
MLFTNDVGLVAEAKEAGIDRIVVDLEKSGKQERQQGYHLEINTHTIDDIKRIKDTFPSVNVLCRINPFHENSHKEIEHVIDAGSDVIMLPMFKKTEEVRSFIDCVNGKAVTSILVETKEAVEISDELKVLNIDEVYVGLNDLSISLCLNFAYEVCLKGILDRLRNIFSDKDFGFGGITVLEKGRPLRTKSIMKEMARLKCNKVIMRRAFKHDIAACNMSIEIQKIRSYYNQLQYRDEKMITSDHLSLKEEIKGIIKP